MMHNTSCENCIFAHIQGSEKDCDFNIPAQLHQHKNISIKNDYNYIKDYRCVYGMSGAIYDQYKTSFSENIEDIKNQIKYNNQIKYYLVVFYNSTDSTIVDLCNNINNLTIVPKFLSVVVDQEDQESAANIAQVMENTLNKNIVWKLHKFVDQMSHDDALHTVVSTNQYPNQSKYMWVIKSSDLSDLIKNTSIEQINYIINIIQPSCTALKHKNANVNNFYTIFLNLDTYHDMMSHVSQSFTKCLDPSNNLVISFYD